MMELRDVNPDENFTICDGRVLKNLFELEEVLKGMGADIYKHHVTESRNDFASWVKGAVGDSVLSDRLIRANRADKAYRLVHHRINELAPKVTQQPVENVVGNFASPKELKGEFVDFLLGLVIGFIIGLIIKSLF